MRKTAVTVVSTVAAPVLDSHHLEAQVCVVVHHNQVVNMGAMPLDKAGGRSS